MRLYRNVNVLAIWTQGYYYPPSQVHPSSGQAPSFCFLHQPAQLTGTVPQQLLQVAHEPVAMHLAYHVPIIVVPEGPAQLLVVHIRFVLPGLDKNTFLHREQANFLATVDPDPGGPGGPPRGPGGPGGILKGGLELGTDVNMILVDFGSDLVRAMESGC